MKDEKEEKKWQINIDTVPDLKGEGLSVMARFKFADDKVLAVFGPQLAKEVFQLVHPSKGVTENTFLYGNDTQRGLVLIHPKDGMADKLIRLQAKYLKELRIKCQKKEKKK